MPEQSKAPFTTKDGATIPLTIVMRNVAVSPRKEISNVLGM